MYRVAWKSRITGLTGHGEWSADYALTFSRVCDGNDRHPDILHWVETKEPTK